MKTYDPAIHTNNIAVYCSSEEQAMRLLKYWHEEGHRWASDEPLLNNSYWGRYERQYYFLDQGEVYYGNADYSGGRILVSACNFHNSPEEIYEGLLTDKCLEV